MGDKHIHVSKKGVPYYLVQKTRKGKKSYLCVPRPPDGPDFVVLEAVPEGYEICETRGKVNCLPIAVEGIPAEDVEKVKAELARHEAFEGCRMEITQDQIVVHLYLLNPFLKNLMQESREVAGLPPLTPQEFEAIKREAGPSQFYMPFLRFTLQDRRRLDYVAEGFAAGDRGDDEPDWEFVDFGKIGRISRQLIEEFLADMHSAPAIGALDPGPEAKSSGRRRRKRPRRKKGEKARIYTLKVELESGYIVDKKYGGHEISRTIQILGDQSLQDLHEIIFDAFEREDEHLYEFFFGKRPYGRKNRVYAHPFSLEDSPFGPEPNIVGTVDETWIDDLNLRPRQTFGYLFDYGDDWVHRIRVEKIEEAAPEGDYPRITAAVGEAPPQYPFDDDED
ncbi:MAG TPA: plasmid pRiA4b ORF-3 family protein [bacterium]|nr:plasmid pRiA4b ORF-3 family protein [bacterium]